MLYLEMVVVIYGCFDSFPSSYHLVLVFVTDVEIVTLLHPKVVHFGVYISCVQKTLH